MDPPRADYSQRYGDGNQQMSVELYTHCTRILAFLGTDGDLTRDELVERLQTSQSSLTRAVKVLIREGKIERYEKQYTKVGRSLVFYKLKG